MAKSNRQKVMGGVAWKFAERITSQGVFFVVSVILARLLSPSEYGIIAMINIFIIFANIFVVSGFNSALIQKKDADALDFSTMFYCSLGISVLLYIIIFFCAPLISYYYDMPELTNITRVFSLSLIINSYQTIQTAYVARHMIFKKNFMATSVGTICAGIIGIIMAYKGFGVWALVCQHISSIIINTLTLRTIVDWRPQLMFSLERAKSLLNYGGKIFGSTFVDTLFKEIRQLVIGVYYTPADLALYNRGQHFPKLVTSNLDNTWRSVLFPAMSNYSDNPQRIKGMLRKSIMNTSYVTYFALTMMAVSSEPLIRVLLTEKWIECVPYMQIFCFSLMIGTVSGTNIEALKALGKSDEVFKLQFYRKPISLLTTFAAIPFGVKAIALTVPINMIWGMYVNLKPTKKWLDYGIKEQLKDIFPGILLAIVLAVSAWPLCLLPINEFVIMFLQIVWGVFIYLLCSIVFKIEAYYYCKDMLLNMLKFRFHQK